MRLRLDLEAENGTQTEAVLSVLDEPYAALGALEPFEGHHVAGTSRSVRVTTRERVEWM